MVAMVITLIVSGAIYGLLSSGQSAFRREPALVERQQNIRIAMDLIARDVQNAGAGMSGTTANLPQVFANNLNNPAGPGSVVSEIVGGGERADYLEIMSNDGSCPSLQLCGSPGGSLFTQAPLPACIFGTPPGPAFAYVSGENGPASSASNMPGLLWINVPGPGGGGGCGNGNVNLPAGQAAAYNPPGNGACGAGGNANTTTPNCRSISRIQLVRYELAPENPALAVNALTNPPSLWRSEMGRRDVNGNLNNGPYIGNDPGGFPSPWQLVARGIDDMQIQYFRSSAEGPPICPNPVAPNSWCHTSGQVVNGDLNTVVQQVRITLSGVATQARLGGEIRYPTNPGGTLGRRGQMTTTITPRASLMMLSAGNPGQWR
jgi:hypothetical protein